jgi:hypothetical protein
MKEILRHLAILRILLISFSRWDDSGKIGSSCFFSYKGRFYGVHLRFYFNQWICTLSNGYVHEMQNLDIETFTLDKLPEMKIAAQKAVRNHFLNLLK